MYQRFSRQVITAGKVNEVVSDSGGPLPKHSVFTGHFIEGIFQRVPVVRTSKKSSIETRIIISVSLLTPLFLCLRKP